MKQDIGYMIKILSESLEKKANEDLQAYGMTLSQLKALIFIYEQKDGTTTQKELEEFFKVSHPTINGILKRLEEKQMITSEVVVNRRLSKIVKITEKGKEETKRAFEQQQKQGGRYVWEKEKRRAKVNQV